MDQIEEIKKVVGEIDIKKKNETEPLIYKDGRMTGYDAENVEKFYEFKTDFESTCLVKGKVMMSGLCSCECI